MRITAGTPAYSAEYVGLSTQAQDNALIVAACSAMTCDSNASNIDTIFVGRWSMAIFHGGDR